MNSWDIQLNSKIPVRLKRHGKKVIQKIKDELITLKEEPRRGKLLKGYDNVRSLAVTTSNGEFRVIYKLIEEDRVILIYLIEPREEVYKLFKRKGSN